MSQQAMSKESAQRLQAIIAELVDCGLGIEQVERVLRLQLDYVESLMLDMQEYVATKFAQRHWEN